jgi:acetyltransferase-like isoleucine patch superfamily enzyme
MNKAGGRVVINCPIRPGLIKIGYSGVTIFDYKRSKSVWDVSGLVTFGGKANIGHGAKISVGENGEVYFGENFILSAESSIVVSNKRVVFGNDTLLSWNILVMDTDFHVIRDSAGKVINEPKDIILGSHVWVGCGSVILKGSIIPNDSIIAANSLVSGVLTGEKKIFGGQPAKELKSEVIWEL